MKHLLILVLTTMVVSSSWAQTIPYNEDFESGNGSWQSSYGQWNYGDSASLSETTLKFVGNTTQFWGASAESVGGVMDDWVKSPVITTNNQAGLELSFDYFNGTDLLGWSGNTTITISYDSLNVGNTFAHALDTITLTSNTGWNHYQVIIPNSANFEKLAFSFRYGGGTSNAGIDNVRLGLPGIGLLSTVFIASYEQCHNANDGEAFVTPAGGVAPYTFLWSNGNTTSTATGLGNGKHYVTVTDNAGATRLDSVEIITEDITDPVITCPTDITMTEGVLNYPDPVVTDACPTWWEQTAGPNNGDNLTAQTAPYVVTLSATDSIHTVTCSFNVTVNVVSSVEEINAEDGIVVYPNPSNGAFTVDWQQYDATIEQIRLVDYSGRIVKQASVNRLNKLEYRNIARGVYILQLVTNRNTISKKVFIGG